MVQSLLSGVAGCPSAGRSLLAGRGEDRIHRVIRLMCAARSLRAHLGSRGRLVLAARASRFADLGDGQGCLWLPSVTSWGAARRAAVGFRRVTGDP